jgi:hypothetical protein
MSDVVPANELVDGPMELWRPYDEDVEVSSVGNVRCRRTGEYRGVSINPVSNYRTTPLRVDALDDNNQPIKKWKNEYVHRMMATAFNLPRNENQTIVDHINRDGRDNRLENLRWCTHSENNLNCRPRKTNTGEPYITKHVQMKARKKNGTGIYEYYSFNCSGAEKSFRTLELAIAARDAHFAAVGRRI